MLLGRQKLYAADMRFNLGAILGFHLVPINRRWFPRTVTGMELTGGILQSADCIIKSGQHVCNGFGLVWFDAAPCVMVCVKTLLRKLCKLGL